MKSILATLLCLIGISSTFAQENSLLWSISGNGLKHTSYLFGTIHMMCDDEFSIQPKVKKAFDSSEQIFLEIDMDDKEEMAEMTASAMGDKKLSETLTPEQLEKLRKKLDSELGIPLEAVDNYSLTTISSLFMMSSMACKEVKSYELEFIKMAAEKEMKLEGLETVAFQLECLSKSTTPEKAFDDLFNDDMTELMESLTAMYLKEDLKAFGELFFGDEYLDDNAQEWLLNKRNANWVARMPKIMKKKPTFFAVGAAHLLGDKGVLALLKDEGYTVTPIFE